MMISVSTLVLVVVLMSVGVAAGATVYRYGPYATLEKSLEDARAALTRTRSELAKERESHRATKDELKVAFRRLGISQTQLKSEKGRRNEAERNAELARQDLLLKERDIHA